MLFYAYSQIVSADAVHCSTLLSAEAVMRKYITALLLLVPMIAQGYPFAVEQQLNGTEIAIDTLDLGNNTASVSLHNYGRQAALCKVRFRNGPELPRTRKAQVAAGETVHLTARSSTTVIKMRVNVECHQD